MTALDVGREAWLAERQGGVGSSDVAAILTGRGYRVWLEKRGIELEPEEQTDEQRFGQLVEPAVLAFAAEKLGITGRRCTHELFSHPTLPWAKASPDWLAELEDEGGIEAKHAGWYAAKEYRLGPDGELEMPRSHFWQVRWQMAVVGRPVWHLAAAVGGRPPLLVRVERDLELERELLDEIEYFWRHHVLEGHEPDPDNADIRKRYLEYRHPAAGAEVVAVDQHGGDLLQRLGEAKSTAKMWATRAAFLANDVRALIGDALGIKAPDGSTAKWGTKRGVIDWKAAALAHGVTEAEAEAFRRASYRELRTKHVGLPDGGEE